MMSNKDRVSAPKSNAKRQSEFRARKRSSNLQEVRGIFATKEQSEKIKQFAIDLIGESK